MKSLPTTPLSPTNNSKPPSMGNSTHNSLHVANNYPPGFNSSVLSPKGANMLPNRSNTTSPPQNKSGNTSGINADLLDLL